MSFEFLKKIYKYNMILHLLTQNIANFGIKNTLTCPNVVSSHPVELKADCNKGYVKVKQVKLRNVKTQI